MWADPRVTRYTGGRAFTREETWARLLRYAGHWAWFGHGFWAIEDADTGGFVGELGFADFQRGLVPALDGIPELGWALIGAVHGRGFASEAVRAALAWGDVALPGPRTACIIDPDNTASIRVAVRCGYRERLRTRYKGGPTLLFERDRSSLSP